MSLIVDRIMYHKDTIKNPIYDNPNSFGRIITDATHCNGCGECEKRCVAGAIRMEISEGSKAYAVIDEKKCIYCGNCIDLCPEKALKNSHDYRMAEINVSGIALREKIYRRFGRSLVLRSVDTGSCNACMQELAATQNTYYALSRYGIEFAASPRHSDGIVVTGPVTINMREALRKTYDAMAEPKLVIGLGACAHDGGIYKHCYGSMEPLGELLPVDLIIPGCPPSPQAIIYGMLKLLDRL